MDPQELSELLDRWFEEWEQTPTVSTGLCDFLAERLLDNGLVKGKAA